MTSRHVVVIGGGAVGVCCAIKLVADGHRVTLLDPGPAGGEQAASYGNAGWFSTASVVPMAMPGVWRKVPRYLADPLGPLAIRLAYLPRLLPWLTRFLAAARVARVEAASRALRPLIADSPARHLALARQAGAEGLIERNGLIYAYPSRDAFLRDALAWRLRAETGISWLELNAEELRQREPHIGRQYQFGVLIEDGANCRDPGAYVAALAAHAASLGATFALRRAIGLRIDSGRLRAVVCEDGEVACDAAVIAAGAHSRLLAEAAGDRVPLETERGYHAMFPGPGAGPRYSIALQDKSVVMAPMAGGVRIAGQVELAGLAAAPDWRRADRLRQIAAEAYPGMDHKIEGKVWMGHRPSTPDSLPCIGFARASRDVVHAFGHGHIGLSSSAMTGQLVADLLAGRAPAIPVAAFSPQRFR
jgi:D-amino-acid dehydrogenase